MYQTLCTGKYVALVSRDGWEYVRRLGCKGVVGVIAMCEDGDILLVEQYRPPLDANCIEIPAGLVGDEGNDADTEAQAAARELLEETGYRVTGEMTRLWKGPTTTGLSSEQITIYLATFCEKASKGGGVDGEKITVHKVPVRRLAGWLDAMEKQGKVIDLKVRLALSYILCLP